MPTPRYRLAAATPRLFVGDTPAQWIRLPRTLSYWNNQNYGCCVTTEEAFNKACSGILISDAESKRWAQSHGVLNGAYLDQVLDWMYQDGFHQDGNVYNDGMKSSIDYTNDAALRNAIAAAPVKIGVAANQLENVVRNTNGWFGLNFSHDGNLDHCISLCGYGVIVPSGVDGTKPGYAAFTWNTVGILDIVSMVNITGEAWSRTPASTIQGNNPVTPDVVYTPGPVPPLPPDPPLPPTPPPGPTPVPDFTLTFPRKVKKGQTWSNKAKQDIAAGKYAAYKMVAVESDDLAVEAD